MNLLAWWLPQAAGFCESTLIVDSEGPLDVLEWPNGAEPVSPDAIFVVHRHGAGVVGALQILDPSGVEVATTRSDLSDAWAVLVPDAPLPVGDDYQLVTAGDSPTDFDVTAAAAGPLEPTPVPVRRNTFSDVLRLDENCPDEAFTVDEVSYRLCDYTALVVGVSGESEPPAPPSIADLGVVDAIGSGDVLTLTDGLSAGASVTVWVGSFDDIGRFQGWVADTLTMPEAGTIRFEQPEGATTSPGITPTAFRECPAGPVTWTTTFEQTCESWDQHELECNEVDADTDASCSCGTGFQRSLGRGVFLALLLAWRRRRT